MENSYSISSEADNRYKRLSSEPFAEVTPQVRFFKGIKDSYQAIWNRRSLFKLLTKRELKARYKDSFLGYIWTLVRPLVNLLIYYLVIGKVLGAQRAIPDFAIYVFAGLTIWGLFATIVSGSTNSILANSGIVKKVALPRELFPLTSLSSALVDFCSQFLILIVATLCISKIHLLQAIIYVPISLLVVLVWALALGLVLGALNVYLRDIQYLVEVVLMIGFWCTPTVYSFYMVQQLAGPVLTELYLLNPITLAVMGVQRGLWGPADMAVWPVNMFDRLFIMLLVGVVVLFVAHRIFSLLQRNFAQEM